jgi:hypothetical protein
VRLTLKVLAERALVAALCHQLLLPNVARAQLIGDGPATDGSSLIGERGSTGAGGSNDSKQPRTKELEIEGSQRGDAQYTIPVPTPLGAGGVRPPIVLAYASSARRPSWVGYGWSMTVGEISRSLVDGVPTYDDEQDAFEWDGRPLVRSLDPAQPNRYHTRIESFARVEKTGTSWEVRSKDGSVARYGIGVNSRVANPVHPGQPTFRWLLAEREDRHGNITSFLYDESDPGERYIKEIRYTLRRSGGVLRSTSGVSAPDESVDRVVQFALEPRPDRKLSYASGFASELNKRLRSIEVRSGSHLIRKLVLGYTESLDSYTSLLTSVSD